MASKTFMRITNQDIYDKIEKSIEKQDERHTEVCSRLDRTNGRVKLNRWIGTTAMSLIVIIISCLIGVASKNL